MKKLIAAVFPSIAICVGSVGVSAADAQVSPRDLCNQVTEHHLNENKEAEGVRTGSINIEKFLVACREAVERDPTDPTLQFQLGRILEIIGSAKEAVFWYREATEQGHAQALRNLTKMRAEDPALDRFVRDIENSEDFGSRKECSNTGAIRLVWCLPGDRPPYRSR
jgi:TPR repeat protein